MPAREHLGEEGPVRVAVEVDLPDAQSGDHAGQVVGRQRRSVEVGARAQLAGAGCGRHVVRPDEVLERGAVDDRAEPGPALVDQEQVASGEQRTVHRGVEGRAVRR